MLQGDSQTVRVGVLNGGTDYYGLAWTKKNFQERGVMCWRKGKLKEPVRNKNVTEEHSTSSASFSNIENSGGEYIKLRLEAG